MRQVVGLLTFVFLGITVIAYAVTIPNTFSSGTTISSSAVNDNFTAVKNAVDALELGPTVLMQEASATLTIPTSWSSSTPICTTAPYTPSTNQRAIIDANLTTGDATQRRIGLVAAYSTNGGGWSAANSVYAYASNPAGGYVNLSVTDSLNLTIGTSYIFSVMYDGDSTFTSTLLDICRLRVVIVPR